LLWGNKRDFEAAMGFAVIVDASGLDGPQTNQWSDTTYPVCRYIRIQQEGTELAVLLWHKAGMFSC